MNSLYSSFEWRSDESTNAIASSILNFAGASDTPKPKEVAHIDSASFDAVMRTDLDCLHRVQRIISAERIAYGDLKREEDQDFARRAGVFAQAVYGELLGDSALPEIDFAVEVAVIPKFEGFLPSLQGALVEIIGPDKKQEAKFYVAPYLYNPTKTVVLAMQREGTVHLVCESER